MEPLIERRELPEAYSSEQNTAIITYKNNPKLSEHDAERKFNERRLNLLPQIDDLIRNDELFSGKEVSVEFAQTGVTSLVCFLETSVEKYVLKVPLSLTDGGGSEARFLTAWEEVGVSVPHVFRTATLGDHALTIVQFVDAPPLNRAIEEGSAKATSYKDMGRILAHMHMPATEGYGRIVEGKLEFDTFKEWLMGQDVQKRVGMVRERELLRDEHGSIETVFDALLAYSERHPSSTYCHFDYGTHNILATDPLTVFDPSPMLNHGIIDIGRSLLAQASGEMTDSAANQLREGYFSEHGDFDQSALQASTILNAYWKLPYVSKKRPKCAEQVREYLAKTSHLLSAS